MANKKQIVRYRNTNIRVDVDYQIRKHICQCCGRTGKCDLHHWKYEFTTKEVKKNPELALKNTSELCFTCHNIANSMKHIYDADEKIVIKLIKLKENIK